MENPAFRLHNLLESAYKYSSPNNAHIYPKFRVTWSKVFNVNANDTSSIMISFSSMLSLTTTLKQLIEKNEPLNDDFSKTFLSKIDTALSNINFEGDSRHFYTNMNSETLTFLYSTARSLDLINKVNNSSVSEEKIKELIEKVDTLLEKIRESSLPNKAIELLVKNLNNIREALNKYRFFGEESLVNALEQTIGSMVLHKEVVNEIPKEDKDYQFFLEIFIALGAITTFGSSLLEIAAPFIQALPIPLP